MRIELLSKNQKWLPFIAKWYFEEWGYLEEVRTIEKENEKLHSYLNENKVPLILVAIENDELLGVAQLKMHEMSIYPNYKYWLGGVYVSKQHRNMGIAKSIVVAVINKAMELKINKLYLQTENLSGGLYAYLGWSKIEKVNYNGVDVVVMENEF